MANKKKKISKHKTVSVRLDLRDYQTLKRWAENRRLPLASMIKEILFTAKAS